jgi:hypothetical protein
MVLDQDSRNERTPLIARGHEVTLPLLIRWKSPSRQGDWRQLRVLARAEG